MQTLTQIRRMLLEAGLAPNKALGQNFLVDLNLMGKLLGLAQVGRRDTVLEVGPGTGSLTEELAERAGRVVAVEIDRGLHGLLSLRLAGRDNVTLLHADALAGKHALSPAVVEALSPRAVLVSNLPYGAATPLVAECLLMSRRAIGTCRVAGVSPARGEGILPSQIERSPAIPAGETPAVREGKMPSPRGMPSPRCLFDRLTFTVQREAGDRMMARAGEEAYGPLSVIVALLGKVTAGPLVPASAFWPRPKVASRILRIDFDAASAGRLADPDVLARLLSAAFGQRRKQIGSLLRREDCPFDPRRLSAAFEGAGIDPRLRAEGIGPSRFLEAANSLASLRS